jgi:serine/threonine protein kinase/tetratricopeptide (TPR) repeat protein
VSASIEQFRSVIIERYGIEREIGRGGMATVYLAHDLEHDRQVAIKVLNTDVSVVLGAERFKREVQVTTLLSHPHILPIYDSGLAGGSLYYVMPYVEGESLRARLDRERNLSIADAIRITCEIADALEHAHKHGIIHRDIKPENILLDDGRAVLADFGIAHAMTAAGEQRLTQTGMSLGTPTYMSPEQATAERSIDGRSDVYSLACVTYEMLGGQPPFTGPTAQAIIARHTLENVPSLTIIRNTVPPQIEAILIKALAKVPADRYATAREFAEALRHPETQTFLVPSAAKRAVARRIPLWQKIAAGAVVAAIAGGGYVAWLNHNGVSSSAGALAGPDPSRIAVLYLADESDGKKLGYLASGLTDALIDRLSAIPQLQVSTKNASALFANKNIARDSIARALNVGTLVDGSVEQHGDQISVTVKLDDASGSDFRRTTFSVPAASPLALQDTLASRVANFLRERLGQEITLRDERAGTTNTTAWTMLQQAKLMARVGDSARAANDTAVMLRNFARADSTLAAAARVDPKWAAIPILRGTIDYHTSRFYSGDQQLVTAWDDTGLVHAQAAFDLAPRNADAYELRGTLRYWRWLMATEPDPLKAKALLDSARSDLETSTQISPNQPEAWSVLSHLYYQYNDVVSAKLAARRAYDEDAYLSEADLIVWRLFTTSYDLEQFPDGVHWCDVGAVRFPSNPRFVECKLLLMGTTAVTPNVAVAWRMADSLVKLSAGPDRQYARLNGTALVAGAIARAGLKDSAAHVLARIDDRADVDPTKDVTQTIAMTWVMLGDSDKAIKALALYLSANPARAVGFDEEHSWEWRRIHDDPRFQALVVKPKK